MTVGIEMACWLSRPLVPVAPVYPPEAGLIYRISRIVAGFLKIIVDHPQRTLITGGYFWTLP